MTGVATLPKGHFQQYYSYILLIIYIISEEQQQQRPFNGLWSGTTRVGRFISEENKL